MDIYEAANQGNIDAIKSAVERGCDVNGRDKDGNTPLWFAAKSGRAEACRFLLSQGASAVEAHNSSILEVAVQGGHADIVALLWPHCDAAREHRSLESAISLGFHEIADFLIETGGFEYQECEAGSTNSLMQVGFPERKSAAFQQWERFLFVRRGQKLPLHHLFLDYALLLAAKADRNAGLRLVEFLLGESMADVNCKIMVNEHFETPLTAAAENGNLEILAALIAHPNTNVTVCGKYNWPAFLHLLASPLSVSTERGRVIAHRLSYKAPCNRFFIGSQKFRLESAFSNVLRFGDDGLVKQVIDLVHGAAGILILPLLIRANEADGVKWILNSDTVSLSQPPQAFWVLLCQYFERHEDQNALDLFTIVAEFLVENKIWDYLILKCLHMRNFPFVQQFFYYSDMAPPKEVTEKTLIGLPAASADQSLIKAWAGKEFASAVLWDAMHCGLWTNPAFERLIFISNANLNGPDPHRCSRMGSEVVVIPHAFFNEFPNSEGQGISVGSLLEPSHNPLIDDYQMQLTLLAQHQNKRRARSAQDTKCPLSWAIINLNAPLLDVLLLSPQANVNSQDYYGRTPLMYAIAVNHKPIVERLLDHRDIDLNVRDDKGRTAIFYAAQAQDPDIVQLLLGTQKVDYAIRNRNGQTVKEFAKKTRKKKDIVTALSNFERPAPAYDGGSDDLDSSGGNL